MASDLLSNWLLVGIWEVAQQERQSTPEFVQDAGLQSCGHVGTRPQCKTETFLPTLPVEADN